MRASDFPPLAMLLGAGCELIAPELGLGLIGTLGLMLILGAFLAAIYFGGRSA
jgi:hypothetical protein